MAGEVYNFLPIPEIPRPQNDANQQIADSLFRLDTENNLQSAAGWDGMAKTIDQVLTLTQVDQLVTWDESMSNNFGSIVADPVTNEAMVFGPGVIAQTIGGVIRISLPSGIVRSVILSLIDLVTSDLRGQQIITVEKQVDEVFFNATFLSQISSINAWAFFIKADVGDANFEVTLEDWTWFAWKISPLGYSPPAPIAGVLANSFAGNQFQNPRGFFGGLSRDVASGLNAPQIVNGPAAIDGFDIVKPARSIINAVLAAASIEIESDGVWDVRFSVTGMVELNQLYRVFVWLNGSRTECGAAIDPSNQTDEITVSSSVLLDLSIGDVLELQIESSTGPSTYEFEFGSFTALKAGESP